MEKQKEQKEQKEQKDRKVRKDIGGRHRGSRFSRYGTYVRRYGRDGRFEGEWQGIREAVDAAQLEGIDATYMGVYMSVMGRQNVHAGRLWRSNASGCAGVPNSHRVKSWEAAEEWLRELADNGLRSYEISMRVENVDTGEVYERVFNDERRKDMKVSETKRSRRGWEVVREKEE